MSGPATTWRAEDLRDHAQWMRALARALVRDSATAEDLVQETCVRALTDLPKEVRSLRAWLRRVLQSLAWQHYRSESHRTDRELGSTPHALPVAPDVLVERMESQRILGEEFPHLPEPYRTMLWLRFYEDVEPVEIARRMGLPGGTVRWRIKRGLELLRGQLDERHGGKRSTWCSIFFAVGGTALPEASRTLPLLPLVVMKTTLKVGAALAAVLLAVVAFTKLNEFDLVGERAAAVTFEPIVAPVSASETPRAVPDQAEQRVVVDPVHAAPRNTLAPESGTSVLARFVDESGRGIPDVTLRQVEWSRFAPRTGLRVQSDAGGAAELAFPAGYSRDGTVLDAMALGFVRHEVMVDVTAGESLDLGVIVLRQGGAISGRVVDPEGLGLSGVRVCTGDPKRKRRRLDARRIQNSVGTFPDTTSGEGGEFVLIGLEPGFTRLWGQVDQGLASYSRPIEVRAGQTSTGVTLVLEDPLEKHIVHGVVLDPAGQPVPNAQLKYCYSEEEGSMSTETKWALPDGTFEIFLIDDLKWWLRAIDPDDRFPPVETAHYEDAPPGELVIAFTEAAYVDILGADRAGRPVEVFGFRIFSPGPGKEGQDARHTLQEESRQERPDGRARFRVPAEEFFVEVDAAGFDLGSIGPLSPGDVAGELRVTLDALPCLSGRVFSADGPVAGASVSLHQVAEDLTIINGFRSLLRRHSSERVRSDDTGTFVLTPRETGEFVIRAEAAGFATAVWGPFEGAKETGRTDIEIVMGQGGRIAGRLIFPDGAHPASRTIGASRGDGRPLFTQSDATGAYRFDDLTPGPWEVRFVEKPLPPGTTNTERSPADPLDGGIEWNCEVQEGRVTQLDIYSDAEPTPAACKLAGQMLFDLEGEWIAGLGSAEVIFIDRADPVPVTIEGRFELAAHRPGRYRLNLINRSSFQYVIDLVELVEGTTSWSMEERQGSLEVAGMEPMGADAKLPSLVHRWRGPGELLVITALMADENGSCIAQAVPAGTGELVVFDEKNMDPTTWEVVQTVTVRSNQTTFVNLK